MNAARLAFVFVLLMAPDTTSAHPAFAGVDGFAGGMLHPFFVFAHALGILASGLMIAQQTQHWRLRLAFVAGLAGGFFAIASAYVPTLADMALLVLALIAGVIVALARPVPPMLGVLLATAVGGVIALDSPPEAMTVRAAIETQLGTFCGATIFLYVASEAASRLKLNWQRIGVRILGSWIAASAVLALTLQLTR